MLKQLATLGAEIGWWNAFLYRIDVALCRSTGRARLFKYYLLAQPVAQRANLPPSRGRSIAVRLVTEGELADDDFPRDPAVISARYRQGAVCLGAFDGASLVGYLWLILGPYEEDEVRCRFLPRPEGEVAWDFDVYVRPDRRFSLAFARLWDEANAYLREHQVRWTLSRVSAFNRMSRESHRRLGAVEVGRALFVVWGRWQLMLSTRRPYVHLSGNRRRIPQVPVMPPPPRSERSKRMGAANIRPGT